MFQTGDASTAELALDVVLDRLAAHQLVDAILVMGSAAATGNQTDNLRPVSDYDLFVVLNEFQMPLRLVLTRVDHRLTEVYFASAVTVEDLAADASLPPAAEEMRGAMIKWIQTGWIAFDRCGRLAAARAALADRASFIPPTVAELYDRWAHTSYNVQQTRRMAASDDPTYEMAVNLRLLYELADLMTDYFAVRGLPFQGEKAAVRYWEEHDPAYLALLQAAMAPADLSQKVALYCQLAALALAPVGGLMPEDATAVTLEPGSKDVAQAVGEALTLWRTLVAE